ncbi:2-dehydropantoate 2-reductase [Alisedimentitalea sp. MJ-SS2]|uniref:ketopantoate reductase family protein n=1 Tax=Aliisedimentitalea sp. MJ-SS2 TaxID=3049795 RepID=UPI002911DB2A|nr:2-dehydropantoate 2-reductase [Alisedimentitalea sp. MJ-SS2]MDU8925930.1 2-dehydropantoate 2-reductase [Alisedimentitalea sp. MJ-SS2]
MKILVMGVGAMGSVYAALLADAGHEVWAVDTWAEHVDAINAHGLRLEGASGDRVVTSIRATTDVTQVGPCDLCLIATKASGVGPAARAAAPVIGAEALVLTIQNGLGAGDRISQHIAPDNVLLGVADGFGASMKGPGHAHHNAMKLIRIGELNGGLTQRLKQLEKVWQEAGFDARAFDNITQLIWEKFLCNVTFSAPCTVFNETVGELMANPEHWAIALGAMREAHAIAVAKGIPLGFDDPVAYVTAFGSGMPKARPSMLLDHMAGRVSELDAINGIVPVLGREAGVKTPYNDTLSAVLRQRESLFAGQST